MTTSDADFSRAMQAIHGLVSSADWVNLPATNTLVYLRTWPDDSVDTLAMTSETSAFAERTNRRGVPVWRVTGTVSEVIAALYQVPAPSDPAAPRVPLDSPSRDRDVGAS